MRCVRGYAQPAITRNIHFDDLNRDVKYPTGFRTKLCPSIGICAQAMMNMQRLEFEFEFRLEICKQLQQDTRIQTAAETQQQSLVRVKNGAELRLQMRLQSNIFDGTYLMWMGITFAPMRNFRSLGTINVPTLATF